MNWPHTSTDMKGNKELLKYEDYGINPDIALNDGSDWIVQLMRIIKQRYY